MAYKGIMAPQNTQSVLTKRAASLTRRAYRHLAWETYAPALVLGVLFVSLFVIGAAFGVWQRLGDPSRLIALIISVYFVTKSLIAARRKLMPTKSQARRRVELDSGLFHRPLDTLVDTPALNDMSGEAWQNHLKTAQIQIQQAGTSSLRPAIAPLDKFYLRFAIPVVLLLAFMVGFGDNYERLRASLTPGWLYGMTAKTAHYEAWIDPPEYTGRPPSYFKGGDDISTLSKNAPEGSEFVARISGVKTAPRLIIREGNRTRRIAAKRLGPQSFEARAIVNRNAVASYRIGSSGKSWKLDVAKDLPPTIRFDEKPDAGKRDRLIFTYSLEDDYGVESLVLSLALQSDLENTEQISIVLPGSSVRNATREPGGVDLTKHKWAGKKVQGHLLAVDGKRQVGSTAMHNFVIPDKIFVEPLAKAVAEQRQLLLVGAGRYSPYTKMQKPKPEHEPLFSVDRPEIAIARAPIDVQRAALLIEAITDKPVGVYEDPSVYMGLRNVYRRLRLARSKDELGGIPEDLWAIALRAEFGRLGDALEDMKRAERALNNAMARRAPQREVDALFDRYNEAVDRYMEFLTLEAIKNAKEQADSEGGGDGADFNTDEIQALLDAIEEANRMGDTAAARKALAKLAQLLENMEIQMAQGGGGSGSGVGESMSEEMKEALEDLNDILGEQRRLRDETQDAGRAEADSWEEQNGVGNKQPSEQPSGNELADQQGQIADMLKGLEDVADSQNGQGDDSTDQQSGKNQDGDQQGDGTENGGDDNGGIGNGDIKQALEDAKNAMGRSEDALAESDFFGAGRAQSDAIDALRKAGEGLLEQEAERLKAEQDEDGESQGAENGLGSDPFGRDGGEGVGESDVDIPEKSDQQRARELLEELRRRSGERERDETEREYLERLLERF